MSPEMQAIAQRLEEVERQVAHLEALAAERSDPDRTEAARTVNAQAFVVKDKNGVRRAELGMSVPTGETEEHPWLGIFDADGNVRACLGVHEGLPWLEFYDANQESVLGLRVDGEGPHVGLFYGNRRPAAYISLSKVGPRMSLTTSNGKESVDLLVSGEGPLIMLSDANGKPVATVGVWKGQPSLTLIDPGGKGRLNLQVAPSGAKELFMGLGSEAQPSVGPSLKLEVTDKGPCLKFGKDNSVFWSAP
jgi:hypothetical protein